MGCICAGESDIEHFLTDFIDELKIRKYTDVKYMVHLDRYRPFSSLRINYDEFLRSNQNEVIHNNFQTLLFQRPRYLFYASLTFLVQSDPKNMANNYREILDRLRKSQIETPTENLNFEDLTKDTYDTLFDVLNYYARMVSLDIVEAATQTSKDSRITEEQMKVLKNNYSLLVIDTFVRDLMKDCNNPDVDLDEFFLRNFLNLRHTSVREKLRKIYENYDSFLKNLKPTKKNGTQPKYEYTLPNINYIGTEVNSAGKNNYDEIVKEEDIVCAENDDQNDYENLRLKEEEARFRLQYNNYRRECLYHHNKIRAAHGSPALRESDSLSEYSQQWANFIAETDTLTHSSMIWDGKNVGENIAKCGAYLADPSQLIVNKWYEEKNNFDFNNPSTQVNTKNFTQMVWKDTESIGFGLAYSKNGNTFIVINYYPPGNAPQRYAENVSMIKY